MFDRFATQEPTGANPEGPERSEATAVRNQHSPSAQPMPGAETMMGWYF